MYRLLGRLETGDLSELFRAEVDGQPVVVKLFHARTTDAAYAKVVADAAIHLRPVSHRGIAKVLRVGLTGTRLAVVRDGFGRYTLGQALIRLNTREVHLPPAVALSVMVELLEAVEAAHGVGVIHGAITPGNVLLAEDGAVGVSDFGALAALQASPSLRRAFAGKGRGSYRAPELGANEAATVASDVFALGALMYELLTMREASSGNSQLAVRRERIPVPSRVVRTLNSRIDGVVMRALETDPNRRFGSCAAFSGEVREYLASSGGVPSQDDRRKFVDALFPKDVVLGALGPVPFEQFEISDITGVLAIEAELSEVATRAPFSSDRVETEPEVPVVPWDVPPPAVLAEPSRAEPQSHGEPVEARTSGDGPRTPKQPRTSHGEPVEPRAPEAPPGDAPPARTDEEISHTGPRPDHQSRAAPTDTDHPSLASRLARIAPFVVGTFIVGAVATALVWASRAPPESNGCHQPPPAAGAAYLMLGAPIGSEVQIDGLRVCTNPANRLVLAPGDRRIRVTHLKTGQVYEASTHFEAGKTVKVTAVFK